MILEEKGKQYSRRIINVILLYNVGLPNLHLLLLQGLPRFITLNSILYFAFSWSFCVISALLLSQQKHVQQVCIYCNTTRAMSLLEQVYLELSLKDASRARLRARRGENALRHKK